ncbi:type VII secretion integral membrane protein EccD [Nonomuraea recticatena]|uniref:type VII secretion integral membrane protein EccD n=1 Tax=Nonomuraea recticatena TaxID=46178 RepID=UPI003606D03B
MSATGTNLCKVTVITPRRSLDLGLPSDMPLADIVPTLLRIAGEGLAEAGLAHGGWVLQRMGGKPFDLNESLAELAVHDGELLHLRPLGYELPEVAFDDVADAIATGVRERTIRWAPFATRACGLGTTACGLGVAVVTLLFAGPPWPPVAVMAGAIALILLMVALALSKAVGDPGGGAVLGYAGLPYGFLAGLLGPASITPLAGLGAPHLLSAFGVTLMVATTTGFAVTEALATFVGIAAASFCGLAGTAIVLIFDMSAAGVAAVLATLALAMTTVIPSLSFRLAGLPLPTLPTTAEELRREVGELDGQMVIDKTVVADRFCTGLLGGVAMVGIGAQIILVAEGTSVTMVTSLAISAGLLLRARVFEGRGQRLWLLTAGLLGLNLLAIALAVNISSEGVLFGVVPSLVVIALVVSGVALGLTRAKPSPCGVGSPTSPTSC